MTLNKISKAFFINLDRRKDRLEHINKNLPFLAERFPAINAKNLELNKEIKKIFKKCLKNLTKAEIACSLSHYKLWKQLTLDNEADNYLILEDDVVFKKGFTNFWNKVFSKHIPEDYNLLYLGGCQPWNKPQYHKVLKPHNQYFYNVKKNNFFNKEDHYFHMNAQSYIISKQGASLICQYIEQLGFDLEKSQAQDIFMVKFFNKNKFFEAPESIFHLYPSMSYQLHEENDNTEIDKKSDLRHATEKFNNNDAFRFPNLSKIQHKEIPKKIHLSWKDKNVLDSNHQLIKKGAKNLELLNPDWDVQVYDDEDVNRLLRDSIGRDNWSLIKNKKITEKTDLWRLLKTFQEGGLYVDIDRYIDTPLSNIINQKTSMVLPTFQDIDFSQDFILTCPKNPLIGRAIANNLNYRKQGKSMFFLAVYSYMQSVCEVLGAKIIDRGNNPEYFNDIRNRIDSCEHLETFREIGPGYHTLYRNLAGDFNAKIFEKDKADFYNCESVIHWNTDTQAKHIELKNTNKQKIHNIITTNRKYDVCFCCDENLIRYAINPINAICKKNADNNIVIHFIYSGKEGDLRYIENALVDKSNVVFKKYVIDSLDIPVNKTWRSIEHLSNATNLKLQIPEILKDVSRVVYFDIDTIPYVNLSYFDKIYTQSCGIAMRQEIKNGWRTFNGSKGTATENKNPIPFGDRVIGNSGVMVLDLVKLRQNNFTKFCLKEKYENNYNIPLTGGDQDLINIFCQCNFDVLPDELNILVSDQLKGTSNNLFKLEHCITFQENGVHLLKRDNVVEHTQGVLHFIGKDKPWNSDCLGSEFWRKFSIVNENTNLHKQPPIKIINYFDIDCQLTKNNLCNIVKEIQDKKCNCNMLVFGLGKDSIIYDTVNKGYTLFVETNQAWIDLNQDIKNKILYTFSTTVKDSLPINKYYLNKFDMPDFIAKTKWDIILVDAPPGDRSEAPGRALPIYWSSQIAKKRQATVFIDDCSRDLEKEYCDKFFTEIDFNMKSDIERGEFRSYRQKQDNTLIDPLLKTKQQEFIKLKDKWVDFKDYDFFKHICKKIPQVDAPSDKFTIYNPGEKIAIVSLYTSEISDYAVCSEMSVRDYCLKQGYTFYVYREPLEKNASANWSKAKAILNHIDDHEDIIWMDSDTIIYNPEKRFEDILARCTGTKKIIACEDIGANNKKIAKGMMLNSGVVIFRNHSYTKNLIKKWMNADCDKSSLYASGGDQGILCDILKKSDGFGFNRKIFPMNEFNTEPRFVDENTFILHFMAYPYELKKIFMSYWCS